MFVYQGAGYDYAGFQDVQWALCHAVETMVWSVLQKTWTLDFFDFSLYQNISDL